MSAEQNVCGSVWHFLAKVNDEFSLDLLIKAGHLSGRDGVARAKAPFNSEVLCKILIGYEYRR